MFSTLGVTESYTTLAPLVPGLFTSLVHERCSIAYRVYPENGGLSSPLFICISSSCELYSKHDVSMHSTERRTTPGRRVGLSWCPQWHRDRSDARAYRAGCSRGSPLRLASPVGASVKIRHTVVLSKKELLDLINYRANQYEELILPENSRITVDDPVEGGTVEVSELTLEWESEQ